MNRKPGENRENEKEGGTHVMTTCCFPNAVTFYSLMSQGNFNGGLLESALDRQVFKIKTDESEYQT